ncbi:integration host factor subunit beta [Bordetella sp. BOR01]|uniref:integration host factor subunit beta n=1 Tax=Bordetella sp. BOR01 TaxID=2854779 RepID=UPI001C47EF28|nr:integration host factor subunit beta [Bordetella sp. BOR01]
MTKSELIAALAARYPQLAARDTDYAVKTMLDAMTQALASGQRIEIRGFGSFSLSQRSPRVGRNPKSGEQVLVPGKQVPHFKAGKELRERVDLAGGLADAQADGTQDEAQPTLLGLHAM